MKRFQILRWLPALLTMGVIFWFSSQPSYQLPNFNWADRIVKKGGHMIGYAALGYSYWYGLELKRDRRIWAWALSILFAITDEYHQFFAPGRNATIWDVLIFDNLGALVGLWITGKFGPRREGNNNFSRE